MQEIADHIRYGGWLDPTEDMILDLDGDSQHAAAEASCFADGEEPVSAGVVFAGDGQLSAKGVIDFFRAFHVAGSADADADEVLDRKSVV